MYVGQDSLESAEPFSSTAQAGVINAGVGKARLALHVVVEKKL